MAKEKKLQKTIRDYLKSKGCYVLVTTPGAGIPIGCPDIIGLLPNGKWVALEVKASASSPRRPLQEETVDMLSKMGYSIFVYPESWLSIRSQLDALIAQP